MHWIRSTWGLRGIAALMLVGMLPALSGQTCWANRYDHASTYADWLLEQFPDPTDSTIQSALELASETPSTSLRSFLQAFLAALPADSEQRALVLGLGDYGTSDEAIVDLLQHRFLKLIGEAVLPPAVLVKATPPNISTETYRLTPTSPAMQRRHRVPVSWLSTSSMHEVAPASIRPVMQRTEARPMGP